MPAFVSLGGLKNDYVASGGSLSFGQNIVQNRNASKFNNGSINVGDGAIYTPNWLLNADTDAIDQNAIDYQNFTGPQG